MKKKCFLICAAAALTLGCAVSAAPVTANAQAEPRAQIVSYEDEAQAAYVDYSADDEYDHVITPMSSTTSKNKSVNWVKVILISVAISLLVTGVTVFFIYRGYKHNGETEPYEFTKKAPLELTEKEDTLVDVRITTRRIESDNNNNN